MITSHKFLLGEWLIRRSFYSSLAKSFDRVYFRSRGEYSERQRKLPMLICANHSSWWDGHAAKVIERQLGFDAYLMMEEAQLRRYRFFTWTGCFSVDRQNPRSALQSLQYAATLLKEKPGRGVVIFPQGEIAPNDRRPLNFFSGAAYVAREVDPVLIYPTAIRLEFIAEQHPAMFISLGNPIEVHKEESQQPRFLKSFTRQLEDIVTEELDQLRADVIAGDYSSFSIALQGRASTNRIFDAVLLRKQIKRQ